MLLMDEGDNLELLQYRNKAQVNYIRKLREELNAQEEDNEEAYHKGYEAGFQAGRAEGRAYYD
jgi:flagellar biosynthesis/type III secretory pathway protein FliH